MKACGSPDSKSVVLVKRIETPLSPVSGTSRKTNDHAGSSPSCTSADKVFVLSSGRPSSAAKSSSDSFWTRRVW